MEHPPLFFKKTPKGEGWIEYEAHCGDSMASGLVKEIGGGPEMNEINSKAIERWEWRHGRSLKTPSP